MATMNILWLIVGCGVLAILYGIWATQSVMSADSGSKRMQEISEAVREGAQAYLKRQYATIAIVGWWFSRSSGSRSAGWSQSASLSARSCRVRPASSA
jgi:hypothetical protein